MIIPEPVPAPAADTSEIVTTDGRIVCAAFVTVPSAAGEVPPPLEPLR
jgi:hypothetical protein